MLADEAAWKDAATKLAAKGISAKISTPVGPLLQAEGYLSDGETFYFHCRGHRCWLGVGGEEPASAPYWHWMARREEARWLQPDDAIAVLLQLHERYRFDRKMALAQSTTWWNLRHRAQLEERLQVNTGGLALTWRGASADALDQLRERPAVQLPEDYLRFMSASDGAVGEVGRSWLELWSVERVEREHKLAMTPGSCLVFGSDGDVGRYAFKTGPKTKIVEIRTAAIDGHEVARGGTLVEFLRSLVERPTSDA